MVVVETKEFSPGAQSRFARLVPHRHGDNKFHTTVWLWWAPIPVYKDREQFGGEAWAEIRSLEPEKKIDVDVNLSGNGGFVCVELPLRIPKREGSTE